MKRKRAELEKKIEKYYRWLRRYWYYAYFKRAKQTEEQMGDELHAC